MNLYIKLVIKDYHYIRIHGQQYINTLPKFSLLNIRKGFCVIYEMNFYIFVS